MSTSLTIERYAEMRADMDAGKLRDEVLAYAGIDVDTWTAEQQAWLEKMGAELERERFELTNRYTRAFVERQKAIEQAARMKACEPAADVNLQPAVLPSTELPHEMTPIVRSNSTAAPFLAATKPSFSLSDALPPAMLTHATKPTAPSVQVIEAPQHDDDDAATRTTFGVLFSGPALPFQSAGAHPLEPLKAMADAIEHRARDASSDDLAGTTVFASVPVPPSSALPFQAKAPASADAKAWAELAAEIDFPTMPKSLVPSPESNLETYAALCAELAASPHVAEATFSRYGLSDVARRKAVDDAWKERLRRDPALYARWQQFYRASFERLKK